MEISDKEFEQIVAEGIDAIPGAYHKKIDNLVFVTEDQPTPDQRQELKLHCNQTLFGLYQGIPLTKRGAGYNLVLPDKITIFKSPILLTSQTLAEVKAKVRHTIWHEVAHYFGLDHARIHQLKR